MGANGRLQGRLEVSRAFGDRQFKKVIFVESIFLCFSILVLLVRVCIATYG